MSDRPKASLGKQRRNEKRRRHRRHRHVHEALNRTLHVRQRLAEFCGREIPAFHKGLYRRVASLEEMMSRECAIAPALWRRTRGDIKQILSIIESARLSEYNAKKYRTIARAIGGCGISARIVERRNRRNG